MQKVARILRWGLALGTAALVTCAFERTSSALDNIPPNSAGTKREPSKNAFIPFVMGGAVVRIDDAPLFNIAQRYDGNFAIGFLYQIQPIAFGLSYEHSGLGKEDSGVGPFGFVHIDRSVDTVFASVKVRFSGPSWGTPYFGVAAGGTFQDATMRGVVLFDKGASGSTNFGCTASDSISLALRVGGGVEIPMSPNVSFLTDASFDAYRLSSDIIQFCAPGAGATSAFLLRVGLSYRFDVTESPKPARRPRPPS
jgi:hypothetical protein